MFSRRLFDKSRMTIAAKKRQLQFHLAAVIALAGVSFLPSAMTPMNLVAINQSLSSSSNLSGNQAVLDSVHRSTTISSGWQKAIEVPGVGALNKDFYSYAQVNSLSCSAAGNCSAGGFYENFSGFYGFVVDEVHGIWHRAITVSGIDTLGKGRIALNAQVNSLSCSAAGNCSAGGFYYGTTNKGYQAFVVNEVNGTWQKAIEVPGIETLNKSGVAVVLSLSCPTKDNCSAGGGYKNSSGYQAFVVNEVNGIWHRAIEVPGTKALNKGGNAQIYSLSCPTKGNCSAGGDYKNSSGTQAFVVNEVHGTWQKAIEVPGTKALNKGGNAQIYSLSCPTKGNCSAGGHYEGTADTQAFVVNEMHGTWQKAIEVPGTKALNRGGNATVNSLSCPTKGNCSAGGHYEGTAGNLAFVVNEVNGIWQKAIEVPGMRALNKDGIAQVTSLSCPTKGNCSAGGHYEGTPGTAQVFVVNEVNGIWQAAIEVPGSRTLNRGGNATVKSLSCSSAGNCSAGGFYDETAATKAFVANEVNDTLAPGDQIGILYWILIAVLLVGIIIALFGLYRYLGKKKTSGKATSATDEVFTNQPLTESM